MSADIWSLIFCDDICSFFVLFSKWVYLFIHVSCFEIVLLFVLLSVWALSADYSCFMPWHLMCCYSLVGKCFFNSIFQVLILCAHQLVSALQYLVTNVSCSDLFWILYHLECELSQIMYFMSWQTFRMWVLSKDYVFYDLFLLFVIFRRWVFEASHISFMFDSISVCYVRM